jgi:HPt (histidine-containing phosphotransfer) domain-containing protein
MNPSVQQETPTDGCGEAGVAINSDVLFKNCMGSVSFALTLLAELEASGIAQIETITKNAAAADWAATAEAAHSLKGAAGIIGAEPLQSLAAKIESTGKTADIESIAPLVEGLRQEMERCLVQIPVIRLHQQLVAK